MDLPSVNSNVFQRYLSVNPQSCYHFKNPAALYKGPVRKSSIKNHLAPGSMIGAKYLVLLTLSMGCYFRSMSTS